MRIGRATCRSPTRSAQGWPTTRRSTHIPAIIKFYLSEEPILPNVEIYLLGNPSHRRYVLEHLDSLVKAVGESGGYGC
jgi:uncharacterized circularly permuted ATP-grasp superfamily protein